MTPSGLIAPTDDLEGALRLFRDVLGLKVKFQDGNRYAALDYGGQTLGLVSGEEKIVSGVAMAFRVADVETAVASLVAGGAALRRRPETGPHEVRAVLMTADGTEIVVSAKRPA